MHSTYSAFYGEVGGILVVVFCYFLSPNFLHFHNYTPKDWTFGIFIAFGDYIGHAFNLLASKQIKTQYLYHM
jgi:hypothetical protein